MRKSLSHFLSCLFDNLNGLMFPLINLFNEKIVLWMSGVLIESLLKKISLLFNFIKLTTQLPPRRLSSIG